MSKRDNFSERTRRTIAERVNLICSNPNCRCSTFFPKAGTIDKSANFGVAAHITAASKGGPRFDPSMDQEQRSSARNGIWLCNNCSRIIDVDEERYPPKLLLEWKRFSELEAIRNATKSILHGGHSAINTIKDLKKRTVISLAYDCSIQPGLFIFRNSTSNTYLRCSLFELCDYKYNSSDDIISSNDLNFFDYIQNYVGSTFLPKGIALQLKKTFVRGLNFTNTKTPEHILGGIPRSSKYPDIEWLTAVNYGNFAEFKRNVNVLRRKIRLWLFFNFIWGLNIKFKQKKWVAVPNDSLAGDDPVWLGGFLDD